MRDGERQIPQTNRRTSWRRLPCVLMLLLSIPLSNGAFVGESSASANPPSVEVPASDINRALDFLSRKLAVAVSSVGIRQTIHDAVEKRFDGDTNALWSSLADGSTFNARVAAAANRGRARENETAQIASAARAFPRLQIAIPQIFDSWDPAEYVPLVAFIPEGINDTELETVTAYDTNGNAVLLDANASPKRPVIVLGLNERTDESGNLLDSEGSQSSNVTSQSTTFAPDPEDPDANVDPKVIAARTAYQVRMIIVELNTDNEPPLKGDAEIDFKAKSRDCDYAGSSGVNYYDHNWENLNNDGDVWAPPGGTGRELGHTKCAVVFSWWEDDGGSYDYTLKYGNMDLGVQMDDDDDKIGQAELFYASFQGSGPDTWKETIWSDLEQWTD